MRPGLQQHNKQQSRNQHQHQHQHQHQVVGAIPILFVVVCSKHVCECFFPSGKQMTQAVQMGENHNAKTLKIVEDLVKDGQVETSHVEKLVRTCPRTCP